MRLYAFTAVAVLGAALLWSASRSAARAEDPVERERPATLRYDVRIVRVQVPAKSVETAPALPGADDLGSTTASWSDLLAALQKRGTTQVVLDRSATALAGVPCALTQTQIWNEMQTRRTDTMNTQRESAPVKVGAEVQLTAQVSPVGVSLQYMVQVDWIARDNTGSPRMENATWRGAYGSGAPGTLVLRHAQQDDVDQGTEIYVLVSWRR
jgi:hypothetical protein